VPLFNDTTPPVTYIVLSVPGTLLAKAINPSTAISIGALIWSIAATCQAAAFSPAALYVARLFVGVGESLFGQSMGLYLTYWYLPDELSKRIGLFISAGSVAGACVHFLSMHSASLALSSHADSAV
jgi:MFS family permease